MLVDAAFLFEVRPKGLLRHAIPPATNGYAPRFSYVENLAHVWRYVCVETPDGIPTGASTSEKPPANSDICDDAHRNE